MSKLRARFNIILELSVPDFSRLVWVNGLRPLQSKFCALRQPQAIMDTKERVEDRSTSIRLDMICQEAVLHYRRLVVV